MGNLIIHNVAIPLILDDSFIPPDLEKALNYYPNFIRHSGLDWPIQAYLCTLMKEIDKRKPNGYTGNKAFQEFISYICLWRFRSLDTL